MAKITLTNNRFLQYGGSEVYGLTITEQMLSDGHEITFFAKKFDESLEIYPKIQAMKVETSWVPAYFEADFFNKNVQERRDKSEKLISINLVDDADILICGGNHLGYLDAMGEKPSFKGKKTIARGKSAYQSAKNIVAHSQRMKDELIKFYGIEEEKIKVIYPPVNNRKFTKLFSDARYGLRKKFGFNADETVFLFPSTGHKVKGLDLLVSIFENLDLPVKLAVCGRDTTSSKNVVNLGYQENMTELYWAADWTMLASKYEAFGLVGIESVLCGTPLVFANNIGCCEVLEKNAGIFFDRKNPQEIKEAIEKAHKLRSSGDHKIGNPLTCLNYNPTLKNHTEQLYQILFEIEQ